LPSYRTPFRLARESLRISGLAEETGGTPKTGDFIGGRHHNALPEDRIPVRNIDK
jgi:hypothetical protein